MAEPFLGELRTFSFNFAPKGWATCNGQLLPINQNQALFSLLGTMYGGNGQTNFALPDLRGRAPMHRSSSHQQGERGGEASHTLTQAELPGHVHPAAETSGSANESGIDGTVRLATVSSVGAAPYRDGTTASLDATMDPRSVTAIGSSQPHENRPPYLTLNVCIALQGLFPSQN